MEIMIQFYLQCLHVQPTLWGQHQTESRDINIVLLSIFRFITNHIAIPTFNMLTAYCIFFRILCSPGQKCVWCCRVTLESSYFNYEVLLIYLANLKQKALFLHFWGKYKSLILVVTKVGGNSFQLPFKAPERDKEDIKEVSASLATAKEICLCCSSSCFIITGRHFHIK